MLKQGVNPKIVSEALGHASVAFTLQVYSKSLPTIQENAMMLLNEILPAGVVDSENGEKNNTKLTQISVLC
jgi:hypothetical protein